MGGGRECQHKGPEGQRCTLHTKKLGQPATYPGLGCSTCTEKKCKAHCECADSGAAVGRNAARTSCAPAAAAAPPPPGPAMAPRARSRSVDRLRWYERSSRDGDALAREEGRRAERPVIASHFESQWRRLTMEERPLPPPGQRDSGLICFGVWRDGLKGDARQRTLEMLRSDGWRNERKHSSVHLTLYLAWAEKEIRRQQASRAAALDLGRHLQSFLPGGCP
jgi:hypothetical protein